MSLVIYGRDEGVRRLENGNHFDTGKNGMQGRKMRVAPCGRRWCGGCKC